MYKIEYQQDNGLVTSITDATETPVTLQSEGVAYYNGEIPEDREGFTKELYWGVDPDVNVNTKARMVNSETLYAVYTSIDGWLELATMDYVSGVENRVSSVDSKTVQLEQNVNLFNRRPQGLRFKAQDNTVFAKTMKALALGTDDFTVCVVARTEGCENFNYPLIGFSKATGAVSGIKFYKTNSSGSNGYGWLHFEYPITGDPTANSINLFKTDNTTNLHHIVITRSGTLVTCTINGRLVKSVTQDRVLDFLNFTFDIANTQWFWGGCVTNYAMTQVESNRLLWNGGRYDEVRLPEGLYRNNGYNNTSSELGNINNYEAIGISGAIIKKVGEYINVTGTTTSSTARVQLSPKRGLLEAGKMYYIDIELINNAYQGCDIKLNTGPSVIDTNIGNSHKYTGVIVCGSINTLYGLMCYSKNSSNQTFDISIKINTLRECNCLLEYRPESIRSDRYLNSGISGSDYDLVYSSVKPEIIYDKPYQDVVMLDENKAPDWHPIAMGQEVETPTNIFKAKLPDLGKEWQVSDWKQINN